MDARKRNWTFTAWEVPKVNDARVRAIGWGEEECPTTGRKHYQGMIQFEKHVRFTAVKKLLPPTTHIEPMRGTVEQSLAYCKKDGQYHEEGEWKTTGQRVDVQWMRDQVVSGEQTCEELKREYPAEFTRCRHVLQDIEDAELRKKYRTEMTQGIWYWGPSGVGKSHRAFEGFDPKTCYVKNLADVWWDSYAGHEKIILNDFRGQLKYGELLELVDKWPHTLKRRGREPTPCLAKLVVVTCSMPPERLYANVLKKEGIDQILRRFTIMKLGPDTENGPRLPGGITNPRQEDEEEELDPEEIFFD